MTASVEAGVRLSGHLLSEELGRGGQARVFRAEPLGGGPAVAIKVAVDPRLVSALRAEGEALRRLVGPRFVQVLEERLDDDPPHVVLELCPGGDLARAMATSGGRLPAWRVVELARAILDGVAFAHEEGVVHGDLKPENVLLDADGRPKLADLGLSRAWRAEAARPGLEGSLDTQDDEHVRGTFDYLAPEMRAGGGPSPRTDVFALGVMLHELLLGARPHGLFRRPSEVLREDGETEPVPVELDRVIERALATDPADRYPDAAFMLADLEAGAEGITLEGARSVAPVADAPVLLLAVEEASFIDGALLAFVPALLWTITPGVALLAFGRPGAALGVVAAVGLVLLLAGPGFLYHGGVRWRLRRSAGRAVALEERGG